MLHLVNIAIVHIFALVTPGPDFLLVSRTGLTGNKQAIYKVSIGVTLGVVIWATLALFGLNAIFQYYPFLNSLIMLLGAIYITYLAYVIYKHANDTIEETRAISTHRPLLNGFITNLSNPKAAIYFSSIFSTLGVDISILQASSLIVLVTIETLLWFFLLGFTFSNPITKNLYKKYKVKIDLASSIVFFLFAVVIMVKLISSIF